MNPETSALMSYLDEHQADMTELLRQFAEQPSCGREPEDARRFAGWLQSFLEAEGMTCRQIEVGANAPTLSAMIGAELPGKPILFCGHYDTALYRRFMPDNPFRVEADGTIHGVGVLDMKGGVVIAIFVLRALRAAGFLRRPVKFLFSGDEEACHNSSHGGAVFQQEAAGCCVAFNMETGLPGNRLCVGRRGVCRFVVSVEGVEAHAGNDFTAGRSAIVELAKKCLEISSLTQLENGTTVNVATISGGTIYAAVPKHAEANVEIRFSNNRELERVKRSVLEICSRSHIDGCRTDIRFTELMHVYEEKPSGRALLAYLNEMASQLGQPPLSGVTLGGSSDAAYTVLAGVPTLCSCGAVGEWNHTVREYIEEVSLLSRCKLLALAASHPERLDAICEEA